MQKYIFWKWTILILTTCFQKLESLVHWWLIDDSEQMWNNIQIFADGKSTPDNFVALKRWFATNACEYSNVCHRQDQHLEQMRVVTFILEDILLRNSSRISLCHCNLGIWFSIEVHRCTRAKGKHGERLLEDGRGKPLHSNCYAHQSLGKSQSKKQCVH